MSQVDLAELRRVYAHSDRQAHVRYIMDALPALLDEIETAREENATMRATIISAMVDVQHNLPGNGQAKLSLLLDGIMKAPRNNEERLLEEIRRLTQANADLRKERDRAVKEAQRQDGVAKELRAENERLTDVIFQGEGIDAVGELGITRQNFREWLRQRGDELGAAKAENDFMRLRLAESDKACVYCDLPKEKMGHCAKGFPGCARADDLFACDELTRRDCRMKLIGAAEGLELVAGEWSKRGRDRRFHAQELLERAATLRQDAEGK